MTDNADRLFELEVVLDTGAVVNLLFDEEDTLWFLNSVGIHDGVVKFFTSPLGLDDVVFDSTRVVLARVVTILEEKQA